MKFVGLIVFIIFISSCQSEKAKIVIKPTVSFMSQAEVKESFANAYGQRAAPEFLTEQAKNRIGNIIPNGTFFTPKQMAKRRLKKTQYAAKGYVDLREFDSPIESQFGGTCTAHALRNVIDNKGRTTVSTRHIWNKYKMYSCEAAINAWFNKGCIFNNSHWPHDNTNPIYSDVNTNNCNTYLTGVTYIEDDINKMKESLDNGNPVYIAMSVTNSMVNCDKTLAPTSKTQNGGHALAIMGYKDDDNIKGGGYFIVKNSWGTNCGDNGYQYIPYYHCQRKDMYCVAWSINKVLHLKSDVPLEKKCIKWKRSWFFGKKKCIKWESSTLL